MALQGTNDALMYFSCDQMQSQSSISCVINFCGMIMVNSHLAMKNVNSETALQFCLSNMIDLKNYIQYNNLVSFHSTSFYAKNIHSLIVHQISLSQKCPPSTSCHCNINEKGTCSVADSYQSFLSLEVFALCCNFT